MPVGLYGCGTCLLTLREERRLKVSESRVLRGSKGDKETEEWRKLHNEDLNDLSSTPTITRGDKIKKNEMGGSRSTVGETRGAYRVLVGRPDGRRLLRIPRLRWEDDIKVGLKKWDGLD